VYVLMLRLHACLLRFQESCVCAATRARENAPGRSLS